MPPPPTAFERQAAALGFRGREGAVAVAISGPASAATGGAEASLQSLKVKPIFKVTW